LRKLNISLLLAVVAVALVLRMVVALALVDTVVRFQESLQAAAVALNQLFQS